MIEGVLADLPKAREVYEDKVRAGIDPGIATVSRGNVFTTRVFPVRPETGRKIRLTYVSPIHPDKGWTLPLSSHATVGTLGIPVHRYVVECRVERARQLLLLRGEQGDIPNEVAVFPHHRCNNSRWSAVAPSPCASNNQRWYQVPVLAGGPSAKCREKLRRARWLAWCRSTLHRVVACASLRWRVATANRIFGGGSVLRAEWLRASARL
jgi:hypothetical protein